MRVVVTPPAKLVARLSPPTKLTAKLAPRKLTVKMSGAYVLAPPVGEAVVSFTHTQSTPSDEWSVNHPFGSVPASLLLLNASGKYMIPDTAEVSAVRVVLLFGAPTTGTLRLTKG